MGLESPEPDERGASSSEFRGAQETGEKQGNDDLQKNFNMNNVAFASRIDPFMCRPATLGVV